MYVIHIYNNQIPMSQMSLTKENNMNLGMNQDQVVCMVLVWVGCCMV